MLPILITFLLIQALSAAEFPYLMRNMGQRIQVSWDKIDISSQIDSSPTSSNADGQVPFFTFCGPFPEPGKGKCSYEYDYPVITENSKISRRGKGEFSVPAHSAYANGQPCISAKNDIPNFKALYTTANQQEHMNDYNYQYNASYTCTSDPKSSKTLFIIIGVAVLVVVIIIFAVCKMRQKKAETFPQNGGYEMKLI